MGILDFLKPRKLRVYRRSLGAGDALRIGRGWQKIEELVKLGKPSQMRQAIIEADKLLDYVLTQLSEGETMGERLKNARELFDRQTYDCLWQAHKVRNALVHEAGYEPTYYVAKEAIGNFKKALEALGIRS